MASGRTLGLRAAGVCAFLAVAVWLSATVWAAGGSPQVTNVQPNAGAKGGGTTVVISGANFTGATEVKFGSTKAASFTVDSESTITAVSPAGTGSVDITVTTSSGTSATGSADKFNYRASSIAAAWGANQFGELGNGTMTAHALPATASSLSGVTQVAGGGAFSLAVLESGKVEAWGENSVGELSVGEVTGPSTCAEVPCSETPVEVKGLSESVTAVAAGQLFALALTKGGKVFAWGENNDDQLGDGKNGETQEYSDAPVEVKGLTGVTAIAAGESFGMALLSSGKVEEWGENVHGQLGNATTTSSDTPVEAKGLSTVMAIAGAGSHALAVLKTGKVEAWGENEYGELGTGSVSGPETCELGEAAFTEACSKKPVELSAPTGVVAVAGGPGDSLALLKTGRVYSWGLNESGALGRGKTMAELEYTATPGEVPGLAEATAIAGGENHDLAARANGTAVAWGDDKYGELGNNSVGTNATAPVEVLGIGELTAIGAGQVFDVASGVVTGVPVPTVSALSPTTGPEAGATKVTVTGTGFINSYTQVAFGSTAATKVEFVSSTQLVATAPAGKGTVEVTVTTPGGTSAKTAADKYTYEVFVPAPTVSAISPTTGPEAGATKVTVTGTGFINGSTTVAFGSTQATKVEYTSSTQVIATAPAGSGTVDVTVTTPGGTSAKTAADKYTYEVFVPAPTVSAISPTTGPEVGATKVTVTGTGFINGHTTVAFGSTQATNVEFISSTQLVATAPAGSGTVDVTVTTSGGTSAKTAADKYTYTVPAPAVAAPALVVNGKEKALESPCAVETEHCAQPTGPSVSSALEASLQFGSLTLHATGLGTAGVHCLSTAAGELYNERESANANAQIRAYERIEGWGTSDCTAPGLIEAYEPTTTHGPLSVFVTAEPPLIVQRQEAAVCKAGAAAGCPHASERELTELIASVTRRKSSLPWKAELVRGSNRSAESVVIQRVGMAAHGECGPGEAEATEGNPVKCRAREANSKCYPKSKHFTEVPAGCVEINVVIPQIPLEIPFFGAMEATWRNGVKSGLFASRMEYEEGQSGVLMSQEEEAGQGSLTGQEKVLGSEGLALLTMN